MNNEFTATPYAYDLKCEVCNALISYPDSMKTKDLGYLVCQSFDCRRIMNQKSTMTLLMFQTQCQFQRKLQMEREEKEAARKKYVEEVKVRHSQENQKILKIVLDNNPELSENNTHVVVIPTGLSSFDTLSSERIKLYKAHLTHIVKQATEQNGTSESEIDERKDVHDLLNKVEKTFEDNPALRTISDRLCSLCKGGCCTSGKEHAYLSAISIKRYMNLNPDLTPEDILARYFSYISSETIVGACINQTERGCALPTELRSDTCNAHYCNALMAYQQKLVAEEDPGTVLAIQRAGTCWNSCGPQAGEGVTNVALVDEGEVQFQDISKDYLRNL